MSWRYLTEFLAAKGVAQAALIGLPAVAGAAALGGVRAAQVFYGFLNVAHAGLYLVLVPEGAQIRDRPAELRHKFLVASVVSALLPALWMLFGIVLPDGVGRWLFEKSWDQTQSLIIPMGLAVMAGGILSGGLLGMRATGDARRSLKARLWCTPFQFAMPMAGAALGGAGGFTLGFGLSQAVSGVIWWWYLREATDEIAAQQASGTPTAASGDPGLVGIGLVAPGDGTRAGNSAVRQGVL